MEWLEIEKRKKLPIVLSNGLKVTANMFKLALNTPLNIERSNNHGIFLVLSDGLNEYCCINMQKVVGIIENIKVEDDQIIFKIKYMDKYKELMDEEIFCSTIVDEYTLPQIKEINFYISKYTKKFKEELKKCFGLNDIKMYLYNYIDEDDDNPIEIDYLIDWNEEHGCIDNEIDNILENDFIIFN